MKVPVSWLSEYVDIDIGLDDLSHRLTMAGNEVGSIDRTGWIENVVGFTDFPASFSNADSILSSSARSTSLRSRTSWSLFRVAI